MTGTRLHNIWRGMLKRCNPKNKASARYGKRGIRVCEEWQSFIPFWQWAEANGYEEGLSIDRIDNDGDYSPENCRWADRITQCNNRRTSRIVQIGCMRGTVAEWCKVYGLKHQTVYTRVHRGATYQEAIMKNELVL